MNKNPLYNAILATAYIVLVASIVFYGPRFAPRVDTVLAPIAFLSLFSFSAAVMGYLFVSEPIKMYIDGNKSGAINFFLKTLASFGTITLILMFALLIIR